MESVQNRQNVFFSEDELLNLCAEHLVQTDQDTFVKLYPGMHGNEDLKKEMIEIMVTCFLNLGHKVEKISGGGISVTKEDKMKPEIKQAIRDMFRENPEATAELIASGCIIGRHSNIDLKQQVKIDYAAGMFSFAQGVKYLLEKDFELHIGEIESAIYLKPDIRLLNKLENEGYYSILREKYPQFVK